MIEGDVWEYPEKTQDRGRSRMYGRGASRGNEANLGADDGADDGNRTRVLSWSCRIRSGLSWDALTESDSKGRTNRIDNYNALRYSCLVLQSFGDKTTEQVWRREYVRSFDSNLLRSALRKLLILDAAEDVQDLTVPPGNRLEKLRGDRSGQHSIRINQQWRICFRWTPAGPEDVSIVDYH
jgi:proteic killer suppression protein